MTSPKKFTHEEMRYDVEVDRVRCKHDPDHGYEGFREDAADMVTQLLAEVEAWRAAAEALDELPPEPNEHMMGPDPFGRQQYDDARERATELIEDARALDPEPVKGQE